MNLKLRECLKKGLVFQNIFIEEEKISTLIVYVELLEKWNKVFNLTAVRDKEAMISRHILDSLSIWQFIAGYTNIVDIGSGGGLPGIPLAVCCPEVKFTLVDCNSKKTRFLVHVKNTLSLSNVEVVHSRVENYCPSTLFDCLISRAWASPDSIVEKTRHLCNLQTSLVLMLGHVAHLDLIKVGDFHLQEITPVQIYNDQSARHVVTFTKCL